MSNFYEIEFSKKDNGWIVNKQLSNYKYTRVPNSPHHKTIEDAEQWIKLNHDAKTSYDTPWIDHKINGYSGCLIPLQEWKDSCDEGGFIDYDGHGSPVDENYNMIDMGRQNDFWDDVITPSDYTELGGVKIPVDTKYILWFNR